METKKQLLLGSVTDGISDVFYYDRKQDDELSADDVAALITNGEVSLEELTQAFREEILNHFPDIKVA